MVVETSDRECTCDERGIRYAGRWGRKEGGLP